MNYEQALEASKCNPAGVIKVLEGLEWECNKCNGKGKVSQTLAYTKLPTHNVKPIYKPCNKCNGKGKIPYIWTPQVGEWFISKFGPLCLIYEVGDHFLRIAGPECKAGATGMSDGFIPILEWQVIEEVVKQAGYRIDICPSYECTIIGGGSKCLAKTLADSPKEAVDLAVLELGKEL